MPHTPARFALAVATVLGFAFALCIRPAAAEWYERTEAVMGTEVRVELWADDAAAGDEAMTAVMNEMRHVDENMSPYKPESELSRLNARAAREAVPVSPELFNLVKRSLWFSRETGGAFDITFSSVGYLYDYRRYQRPSDAEIAAALPGINFHHLILDEQARTIRFARDGVRIDLGGIGKGHAVDRCIDLLKERGIAHAIVTAGGDSRVIGDRHGRPWNVGIRDPRNRGKVIALVPLADEAISTSGDYERYFVEKGVRYHHIINPKTGKSAKGIRSVTIVGPDATTTDGLSTSVFVMGVKDGMKLVKRMKGIEAVIVDDRGRTYYSAGLEKH
jgi:thiamine biosynthesis lipoprotein